MVRRHNNQLPDNLPQLQNLIKRDPTSYHEEFQQQFQHFQNTIEVFQLSPEQPNKTLDELVMFMAQVAHCYPDDLTTFPQQLIDLLHKHNTVLDNDMRMQFCKALILLRNKNLLAPTDLLHLFFQLLRSHDKQLRSFLQTHIVTDIKNTNAKHKNVKLNTTLQNFIFTMLTDSNSRAAKMSIDIMIDLYKRNVWNDSRTVNVIATGCFSKVLKVMVASLKFFLGNDHEERNSDDSDSENEIDPREVMMSNKFNKKTRKREKHLDKIKKLAVKAKKNKSKAPVFNFSALHLIHDPQGMAEKLFKLLETTTKRFEIKLIMLDMISRLIGLHNLFLFNYYPYIQRFMQPHQREVTRILQFAAQASHELVPPDVFEPVLKTLANNFITERNSSDVMAVGLNAVREICTRCPLAISEDLLQDLARYKSYRERSVMMAAKSLIHVFRNARPELLHKKDRGRPTEATQELGTISYGQVDTKDYVPGAEILLKNEESDVEINSGTDSDDEQWVDIHHSSDEKCNEVEESDESEESHEGACEINEDKPNNGAYENLDPNTIGDENNLMKKEVCHSNDSETISEHEVQTENKQTRKILKPKRSKLEKSGGKSVSKELAQKVSMERILTDEDFKRIDIANIKKQVQSAKKGVKRRAEERVIESSELVRLGDIENIYKKRKHDKQARIETVKEGQKDREKFGYKDGRLNIHCSKTNREKSKKKNFQMIKHKTRTKVKRSFKDKQIALRNHLLKLKRMK